MQVAIITETNEQVEVIAVKGGWTTMRFLEGSDTETHLKIRNSALHGHTTIEARTAPTTAKAAKARRARLAHDGDKAAKEPREPKDPSERKNGVVYAGYLPQYEKYKATVNGQTRRSIDKGDSLAVTLRGLDLDGVYRNAAQFLHLSIADLKSRFEHLNPGMQRMSLGNMMRRQMKEAAQ